MPSQDPTLNDGSSGQTSLKPALYERVFEDSPDLISIVDRDYVYRMVNSAYLKRYARTEEEIVGRHAVEILGQNVFEKVVRPNLDHCFSGGTVNYSDWFTYPELGRRYMDVYYYPLPDGDDSPNHVAVVVRDITDRKSAADALKESESRFRLLAENIKNPVWAMDLNTMQLTYISPSVESLRGFTAEEVMAQRLDEVLTPAAYEKAAGILAKELSPENIEQGNVPESYTLELEVTCKDGSTVSTEETMTVLFGADGKPKEILGVTRDITERKEVEEKLRQSEEKYRDMFWEAPDIFFMLDLETMIITDANKYALESLEYGPETLGKIQISEIIHPDDFERSAGRLRDMVINKDRMPNFPLRFLTRTGKVRHIEQSGVIFWDDDGNARSFLGLAHDVTERKQAEEDLRLSEERYHRILDASHDMICVIDEDMKVLFANPAHKNMAHMIEGVDQLKDFGMIPAEDRQRIKEHFFQALAGKPTRNVEYRYLTKGRGVLWIEGNANSIDWPGAKRALVAVERDITERKKAEEELRLTNERYQRILDASHDMIFVTDTKMDKIYFLNEATRENASHSLKEWNKEVSILDTIHEDDRDKLMEGFKRTLAGESVRDLEYRAITKEGSVKWISGNSELIDWTQSAKAVVAVGREITERKQTEEALHLSEERYRRILDTSHDMVVVVDENLDILFANKAVLESTGYTLEDIEAQDAFVTIHPDDRERIAQTFLSVLNGEPAHGVEFRGIHKSGETRWVESNADMIYWDEGQRAVINVMRDITGRKQAEEALHLSEERYRMLVEEANDIIYSFDLPTGKILSMNRYAEVALGFTQEEMLSKPHFLDMLHPDEREGLAKRLHEVINGAERIPNFPLRILKSDGTYMDAEQNWAFLLDREGNPRIFQGIARDVTERKKMEKEIELSRERYERILNSSHEMIIVFNEKGDVLFANEAWHADTSYTVEEWDAIDLFETIHEDDRDRIRDAFSQAFAGESLWDVEYRAITDKGDIRWIEANAGPIEWAESKKAILTTVRDVTERKTAERMLRESEEKYRTLVENAPCNILLLDHGGSILYINRVDEPLSIEDVVGRKAVELMQPESAGPWKKKLRWTIENNKTSEVELTTIFGRDYDVRLVPLGDTVLSVSVDITEQRQMEQLLQKSEERYRAVFEQAADSILIIDADTGAILDFNNRAHENLGYTREEFEKLGMPDIEALESRDEIKRHASKVREAREDIIETRHRTKLGEIRDILVNCRLVTTDGQSIIQSIWRDITDSKRAEEEIKKSRKQLRDLSMHLESLRERDRTNIAREIHDELGQTLTVLKMDTAWLARRFPGKEKALVEKTRAMASLIDKTIQSVKRISTELRPSLLDDLGLGSAIEWQAEEFQKHTEIKCEATVIPKDLSPGRELSTAVFRIFQEALTNVARHAQATEITTKLEEIDGQIRLIVRDNGKGVAESETSKAGAFGLVGIRERVNVLGGEMKIVGVKGEGTALTVIIPIDD